MFRVLVSDKIAKEGLAPLLESGQVEVVEQNVNDAPDLDTYDALLVRSATKVTEDVMDRMPKLKIIGRAGVGVDNIDVAAATRRGIIVVNAPDGNTIATAEHTFALMLAMVRKLCLANASCAGASGTAPLSWATNCTARPWASSVSAASARKWPRGPGPLR